MNCSNCGQPLDNGAAFCGNCGQAVQQAPTPAVSPVSAPVNPAQPPAVIQNQAFVPEQQTPVVAQPQIQTPVSQTGLPAYAVLQPEAAHTKKPSISLTLGIVSIIMSFLPIAGLAAGITAIVLSNKAKKITPKNGMATAGLVLGIIGIVFSLIAWGYNINVRANSSNASTAVIQSLR